MIERALIGLSMAYLIAAFALCALIVLPLALPLLLIDYVSSRRWYGPAPAVRRRGLFSQ